MLTLVDYQRIWFLLVFDIPSIDHLINSKKGGSIRVILSIPRFNFSANRISKNRHILIVINELSLSVVGIIP